MCAPFPPARLSLQQAGACQQEIAAPEMERMRQPPLLPEPCVAGLLRFPRECAEPHFAAS